MHRPRSIPRALAATALAALALTSVSVLGACAADGAQRPARSAPPPPQPDWVRPALLNVWATAPQDSDGNGFPDTFTVTAYLFDPNYAPSVRADGSFRFVLTSAGRTIAEWVYPPEQTSALLLQLAPGPGYIFALNINNVASDQLPSIDANLSAQFTPVGGTTIESGGVTSFRLGRTSR
jgi:hypothetical protein